MSRMTEEEAWALDDEVTKNPPRVDPLKARHVSRMVAQSVYFTEKLAEAEREADKPNAVWLDENDFWNEDD